MLLFIMAFSVIFHVLLEHAEDPESEHLWGLLMQLWDTYLLTILGQFEPSLFLQDGWLQLFFQLLVFATNIVMLNVLITIVAEGYSFAQSIQDVLRRRQMADM